MAENEKKSAEIETKSVKTAKPEKTKTEKKGNGNSAWRGFKSEVKKVVWPTKKQVLKGTAVVLLVVTVCAVVLGGLDTTFNYGMEKLITLIRDSVTAAK